MTLIIFSINNRKIAELPPDAKPIADTDELLDIMADAGQEGAQRMILNENQLPSCFFDLKSGLAGEMLQKFSNYDMYLAVTGDFSRYKSNSLKDFIRESNRTGRIVFVESRDKAMLEFSK